MAQNARIFAALILGGGLALGGMALARGPDMNIQMFAPNSDPSFSFEQQAKPAHYEDGGDYTAPVKHHSHKSSGHSAAGYGAPVCVRLCDGSFFPTSTTTGGDAACAAQCPDAPVALYTMPTDRIEDAVSWSGKPYTQLPVAKRYQTSFENTCTCHRDSVATRAKDALHDPTLRKGDVVMTATGFRVYEGNGYSAATERDFVSLSNAGVPKEERASLAAMERASAGSPPTAAPALAVKRPHGNVTVDSGEPAPAK